MISFNFYKHWIISDSIWRVSLSPHEDDFNFSKSKRNENQTNLVVMFWFLLICLQDISFLRVERINSEFISISRFTRLQHMSWLLARPLSHFVDSIIHSILFFVAQQQPCDCFQLLQNSFNFTWNSLRYFHKWTYYQSLETTLLFFYHNKTSNFRNDKNTRLDRRRVEV